MLELRINKLDELPNVCPKMTLDITDFKNVDLPDPLGPVNKQLFKLFSPPNSIVLPTQDWQEGLKQPSNNK